MTYLRFERDNKKIVNFFNNYEKHVGWLEFVRVGAWESWVLFLVGGYYLSASCQDEVRAKTKELNAKRNKQP